MRRLLWAATLVMVLAMVSPVFASSPESPYFQAYMAKEGELIETTMFLLNEKPAVYLQLLDGPGVLSDISTDSNWIPPLASAFNVVLTSKNDGFWLTPTDATWAAVRKTGDWTISSVWSTAEVSDGWGSYSNTFIKRDLTFKVVSPEPVSAGLFLLGGVALAVARRRKA